MMEPAVSHIPRARSTDGEEGEAVYLFCQVYFAAFFILYLLYMIVISSIAGPVLDMKYPEVQVISASVSELKVNGTDLSARWNMTILVTNRSRKLAVNFDAQAFVYCGPKDYYELTLTPDYQYDRRKLGLAEKRLSPVNINKDSQTQITFQLGGVRVVSVRDNFAKEIADAKSFGRPVRFGLKLSTNYIFNTSVYFAAVAGNSLGKFYCDPLEFLFSPTTSDTGILTATSRLCNIV